MSTTVPGKGFPERSVSALRGADQTACTLTTKHARLTFNYIFYIFYARCSVAQVLREEPRVVAFLHDDERDTRRVPVTPSEGSAV